MIYINYKFLEKYAEITESLYKSINEENKNKKAVIEFIDSLKKIIECNHTLEREKQELINYLKDLIENKYTNGKVVWFDSEYAKIYGELCTMAGVGDNRLALVPLSVLEEILSKIEKSDK